MAREIRRKVSKRKDVPDRNPTPPGFWLRAIILFYGETAAETRLVRAHRQMGFPSTQQVEVYNAEAREIRRDRAGIRARNRKSYRPPK